MEVAAHFTVGSNAITTSPVHAGNADVPTQNVKGGSTAWAEFYFVHCDGQDPPIHYGPEYQMWQLFLEDVGRVESGQYKKVGLAATTNGAKANGVSDTKCP